MNTPDDGWVLRNTGFGSVKAMTELSRLRAEISRLTEERDAMAARLLSATDFIQEYCGESWLDSKTEATTILSARDAAQRKAGALWALREWATGKYTDCGDILMYADAIERGDVKP